VFAKFQHVKHQQVRFIALFATPGWLQVRCGAQGLGVISRQPNASRRPSPGQLTLGCTHHGNSFNHALSGSVSSRARGAPTHRRRELLPGIPPLAISANGTRPPRAPRHPRTGLLCRGMPTPHGPAAARREHVPLCVPAEEEQSTLSINTREGKRINLILIPECNYIKPGSRVN